MKVWFSLLFFSFHLGTLSAQISTPIKISAFAPYFTQPGGKIGAVFNFNEWNKENRNNTLFISPEVSVFGRPDNHISFLLNSDFGFAHSKTDKRFYKAYSIGLGYLNTFQVTNISYDLASGEYTEKERESRSYFLPTLNFEFGQRAKKNIGWFSKFSFGRKISGQYEDSGFFAVELGISYSFKTQKD